MEEAGAVATTLGIRAEPEDDAGPRKLETLRKSRLPEVSPRRGNHLGFPRQGPRSMQVRPWEGTGTREGHGVGGEWCKYPRVAPGSPKRRETGFLGPNTLISALAPWGSPGDVHDKGGALLDVKDRRRMAVLPAETNAWWGGPCSRSRFPVRQGVRGTRVYVAWQQEVAEGVLSSP